MVTLANKPNKTKLIGIALCFGLLGSGCGNLGEMTISGDASESGYSMIEERDLEGATAEFTAAIEAGTDLQNAYRGLGICYLEQADYDSAIDAFKASLAESSGIVSSIDYDTNYYLAEAYMQTGDYASAIEVYNSILNLRSKEADAYYLRGVCKLQGIDHDGAVEDFNTSMELEPSGYDRRIMIYHALEEAGYDEEGKAILQTALEEGGDSMSNFEKGQISYYLGNNADAQSYLEKARAEKNNAGNADIILLLGQTGEKQGDYNYAVSVYRSFLAEYPDYASLYNRLGICDIAVEDYESAISDFDNGLSLGDPDMTQTLMRNKIVAYEYAGDFESAKALMVEYRRSYPQDTEAGREEIFLSTR